MRLAPALATALAPTLVGGVALAFGACGGPSFTAAPTSDAGPSDAPASTGPLESFCELEAGTHTFCDDFDDEYDGATLTSLWPTYDRSTGATAQDDAQTFVSSPRSFEAACGPSVGALLHARLGKQFAVASRVLLAFDVHLDAVGLKPSGVGGTTFALLTLGNGYSIGLTANNQAINGFENITFADGGTDDSVDTITPTPPLLGTWVHVSIDVNLAQGKLAAVVNGNAFGPVAITPPSGIAPTIYLGLSSREVAAPVEAHYDNVTIDVTPVSP